MRYLLLALLFLSTTVQADPKILFTDLITGPDIGLNDTLGSGVIVTAWGQNLGDTQGTSTIEFCDSLAVCRAGYVYYWKRADGQLPSGPANLYESHKIQEIAFSIPDSAVGAGTIKVTVSGKTSTLPFTVRTGSIYHVKASGNDTSGNGSFASPWKTVQHAINVAQSPGTTIYAHNGVVDGNATDTRAIYWNKAAANGDQTNQYAIVTYPGSRATATGYEGFTNYHTEGQVVSKYTIYASNCTDSGGQPTGCGQTVTRGIQTTKNGRAVGNEITDQPGGCASGSQGAINGNALSGDRISSYKILGNYVHDYGCDGSRKFHHTTYMSIRSQGANLQVPAWEFGWNYLRGNKTKNGIHNYDENTGCGDMTTPLLIHDNVVIDQGGAGISIGTNSACQWSMDVRIYNNILINVGLAAAWDGVDVNTSDGPDTSAVSVYDGMLTSTIYVYDNIIYKWNADGQTSNTRSALGFANGGDNVAVLWNNNICYTEIDIPFIGSNIQGSNKLDNASGANNVFYYTGSNPTKAVLPGPPTNGVFTNNISNDPLLSLNGPIITLQAGSSAIGQSSTTELFDIYSVSRAVSADIGAVEYAASALPAFPSAPASLSYNPPGAGIALLSWPFPSTRVDATALPRIEIKWCSIYKDAALYALVGDNKYPDNYISGSYTVSCTDTYNQESAQTAPTVVP